MFQFVLCKYLNNRYILINDCLNGIIENPDADKVHRLRLEIKKLNALSQLVYCSVNKNNAAKVSSYLKSFYKHLGLVRAMYQSDLLAKEYQLKIRTLSKKKDKLEMRFLKNAENFKVNIKKSKQVLKKSISKASYSEFQDFVIQIYGEINIIASSEDLKPVEIHALRKKMKYFLFLSKILEKFPEDWKILNFPTERIHVLQEKIGLWHDKHYFFKEYRTQLKGDPAFEKLKISASKDLEAIKQSLKQGL